MRTLASLVVLLILRGEQPRDPALVKKEIEALRGSWNVKEADNGVQTQWSMVEDSLQIRIGGVRIDAKFRVNPSKKPKETDIITVKAHGSDRVVPGIYRLDGDTLEIRLDESGMQRPTEFKATGGYVMEREKKKDK